MDEVRVPLVDLKAAHAVNGPEIKKALARVVDSGRFTLGPETEALEEELAEYVGTRYAVALNSGYDALEAALRATGIDDEYSTVAVPALTYAATAMAVVSAGAVPVFYDVDPETLHLDIDPFNSVTAAIPVHLYGRAMKLDELVKPSTPEFHRPLFLIEDCAQSIGACYPRTVNQTGRYGRVGCFSFYPSKNLGALGDGGAIVTSDPRVRDFVRMWRNQGQPTKYQHDFVGRNSRMDEMTAAVLRVKLRDLDAKTARRQKLAGRYYSWLHGTGDLRVPGANTGRDHVYHVYAIQTEHRDALRDYLALRGVETGIHYPVPVPLTPAFRKHRWFEHHDGDFPVAEQVSKTTLSLPMYPELSESLQDVVISAVRGFFEDQGL